MACSDGGADKGVGSFGWILQTENSKKLLSGMGTVDGDSPTSFRTECNGILAILCIWSCLSDDNLVTKEHRLKLLCDSKSAVKKIEKILKWPNYFIGRDAAESDILYCIKFVANRFHGHIEIEWIKGHQDQNHTRSELSIEAQMNVEADRLATKALLTASPRPITRLRAPAQCNLILRRKSITSRRNNHIKRNIDSMPWSRQSLKDVDGPRTTLIRSSGRRWEVEYPRSHIRSR